MAEILVTAEEQALPPTREELMAELQKALNSGDFRQVAKVSGRLAGFQAAAEKAASAAQELRLRNITLDVKQAIQEALEPFTEEDKFEGADGVWFSWDFGEMLITCRLVKTLPKQKLLSASDSLRAAGRRFSERSEDLLAIYGSKPFVHKGQPTGATCQEQHDSSAEKNSRYQVREVLLAYAGVIEVKGVNK